MMCNGVDDTCRFGVWYGSTRLNIPNALLLICYGRRQTELQLDGDTTH
jgi:hypothetical protein